MPAPGSRHAPDFNSKDPEELKELLEEFEELAKSCSLTEKEKAKVVVKYIDKETNTYWKRMEGYDKEWEKLKNAILDGYLISSLDGRKPTVAQLVKILKSYKKGKIEDKEELDTYHHKFWIVMSDLVEAKVIDKKWRDKYFWKSLPLASCNASFESEDVLSMKDAIKAGGFVLRRAVARGDMKRLKEKKRVMELSDEESSEDDIESSEESEDERKMKKGKEKGEVRTKVVWFEEEGKGLQEKVDKLMRKLLQLDVKDDEYAKAYAQLFLVDPIVTSVTNTFRHQSIPLARLPIPNIQQSSSPYDPSCHFCKRHDCHMKTCSEAAEYMRWGWIIFQPNGYYVHSDRSHIGQYPRGLKAAIDLKCTQNDTTSMTTTSCDHPPHMPAAPPAPSAFTLYIGAVKDDKEFVWGAMTDGRSV
ncbi:hypothetical protein AN958_03267 [Leucoagaricus sp. SymC.cos]|nr:hypothetical protein AN958_03267 [Leucoagaricus sp. SymC.cos]